MTTIFIIFCLTVLGLEILHHIELIHIFGSQKGTKNNTNAFSKELEDKAIKDILGTLGVTPTEEKEIVDENEADTKKAEIDLRMFEEDWTEPEGRG
ncbi:MAG: hypothetical protein QXX08_07285 [Candidatus Bathyarchaeia archaeon]